MFSKIAAALTFVALVAAAPAGGDSSCNTGTMQCCNSVQNADHQSVIDHVALLGPLVNVGDITGQVGLDCSPISAIGVAGNSCSQQPTCCTGNNFNGLVVVGCTPINVNL